MELHGENPFKTRSYANAYNTIRRLPDEVFELSREELMAVNGIGKNIADKIEELKSTGNIATLQSFLDKTPAGIVDMLSIKGLGAKKILSVWKELGIESAGELLYACQENRLVELKGFGAKTQESLAKQLVYFLDARGKYLYGHIIEESIQLLTRLREDFSDCLFSFIHDVRRQMPIVEQLEIIGTKDASSVMKTISAYAGYNLDGDTVYISGTKFNYLSVSYDEYYNSLFQGSASPEFLTLWQDEFGKTPVKEEDEELFKSIGWDVIPSESRELQASIARAKTKTLDLICDKDIKGVVHNHSTYSDGANTLRQMADATKNAGYEYLVISDHSKSAFYANGLSEERIYEQMAEIDELNDLTPGFKIFKGIESDILYDGQLDYEDEVLELFDVVIASVHSNLKMDVVKATDRVINAVRNPYTRILGHPTGRLLLSREGYPLDHEAVIDACAACEVVIELNANPYRLDLDWTWIPYAIEKGVRIAINPDAHSINGIFDIQYGVSAARKALVRPWDCLNTLSLEEFTKWASN